MKKKPSATATSTGEEIGSSAGYTASEKPPKQPMNVLIAKHASKIPEKVSNISFIFYIDYHLYTPMDVFPTTWH